jgi:hypothetical protein
MSKFFTAMFVCFWSCSTIPKEGEIHFLVPNGYTGWVNIQFNDSLAKNESIESLNSYFYFVTGDPANFSIRNDKFRSGHWVMNFYYYDRDSLRKLKWPSYPYSNILFEGTIGSKELQSAEKRPYAYTFYVTKEEIKVAGLSMSDLPENPIRLR